MSENFGDGRRQGAGDESFGGSGARGKIMLVVAALGFAIFMGLSYAAYNSLSEDATAGVSDAGNRGSDALNSGARAPAAGGSGASSPAPDFSVLNSRGEDVNLSDMRGKPTIVNFWATWCPPCRSEMPHFEEAYRELGGEVNFMMVDLTVGGETRAGAEEFVKKQGFTFPVYFDTTGEAAGKYGVSAIPTSVFIDADGNIAGKSIGMINKTSLMKGIDLARTK
jgi:thiol-disulfide isomerase/thioredoxin